MTVGANRVEHGRTVAPEGQNEFGGSAATEKVVLRNVEIVEGYVRGESAIHGITSNGWGATFVPERRWDRRFVARHPRRRQ
jgi:hypothetical protein